MWTQRSPRTNLGAWRHGQHPEDLFKDYFQSRRDTLLYLVPCLMWACRVTRKLRAAQWERLVPVK
jgi:hypothetical protein